jgi:hypothetical protein
MQHPDRIFTLLFAPVALGILAVTAWTAYFVYVALRTRRTGRLLRFPVVFSLLLGPALFALLYAAAYGYLYFSPRPYLALTILLAALVVASTAVYLRREGARGARQGLAALGIVNLSLVSLVLVSFEPAELRASLRGLKRLAGLPAPSAGEEEEKYCTYAPAQAALSESNAALVSIGRREPRPLYEVRETAELSGRLRLEVRTLGCDRRERTYWLRVPSAGPAAVPAGDTRAWLARALALLRRTHPDPREREWIDRLERDAAARPELAYGVPMNFGSGEFAELRYDPGVAGEPGTLTLIHTVR